ncbi:ATP-binding cassette domain-containing protein [Acetobacterium wieringae]|uniref:ATP-binding cassette domain-containing protein n=1 Tax=Acetobacterium wieringae TaxID=52694 RepID=UPI0026EA8398|nr:ATP-binding cassette domain-containing protein [Acetobacterium wieringae]
MTPVLISLNSVSKYFGKKLILNDIDLKITPQSAIALLGPNGSGKSTLLKIIAGLSKISSGTIDHASQLKIAYIPENFPKIDLNPQEFIKSMALIGGLSPKQTNSRMAELFQAFQLEDMVDVPIKHLSKGTIQKVAVIQALLTTPDLLLLDEPLSGQDSQSQQLFIRMVQKLQQQGVATLMSCHEPFLVKQLAHSAYELSDHQLIPVDLSGIKAIEYDVMIFDAPAKPALNSELRSLIKKATWDHNLLKLIVCRENSNAVLIALLNDGFKLRTMEGMKQ